MVFRVGVLPGVLYGKHDVIGRARSNLLGLLSGLILLVSVTELGAGFNIVTMLLPVTGIGG